MSPDEQRPCSACGTTLEQIWWKRPRGPAQWGDKTAVMVLVNNDPNCPDDVRVRYVGSHEARIPAGYERVYLRSLREVDSFERAHGVANERMHFDRNGRGLDDYYRNEKMTH